MKEINMPDVKSAALAFAAARLEKRDPESDMSYDEQREHDMTLFLNDIAHFIRNYSKHFSEIP